MPTAVRDQYQEVRVSDWRYSRHVIVSEDSVAMEIARTHCSHCPTCAGRIEHVKNALGTTEHSVRHVGGGMYIVLPYSAERARDARSVAEFLSQCLGVTAWPV